MIIVPKVFVTPDRPIVRFKQPKDHFDIDKEIHRVLNAQGWGLGTYFSVQFVNHDETELISQAEYVVSKDTEDFQTKNDNQYNPSSKTVHVREFIPVGGNDSNASQAISTLINGLDRLEGEFVEVVADGGERAKLLDELIERVVALENRPKPGRKPKPVAEE